MCCGHWYNVISYDMALDECMYRWPINRVLHQFWFRHSTMVHSYQFRWVMYRLSSELSQFLFITDNTVSPNWEKTGTCWVAWSSCSLYSWVVCAISLFWDILYTKMTNKYYCILRWPIYMTSWVSYVYEIWLNQTSKDDKRPSPIACSVASCFKAELLNINGDVIFFEE